MFRIWALANLRQTSWYLKLTKHDHDAVFYLHPFHYHVYLRLYGNDTVVRSKTISWKEAHQKIILLKSLNWRKHGNKMHRNRL